MESDRTPIGLILTFSDAYTGSVRLIQTPTESYKTLVDPNIGQKIILDSEKICLGSDGSPKIIPSPTKKYMGPINLK